MEEKTPHEDRLKSILSYALLAAIFMIDILWSLGVFGGMPYVIGMVIALWFLKPGEVLRFGIVCGVLVLVGFFSPPSEITATADGGGLMNRFIAIFTVVAIALLIRRQTDSKDQYEEETRHLNTVIDKRTQGLKQVADRFDETKQRLAESEELGHFGFWEYDPLNRTMNWSHGVFAIYGLPVMAQAPGWEEFLDRTHLDDIDILKQSVQYSLNERKSASAEYRIIMRDGSEKWISYRGRPMLDQEGAVEMLVGTIQDITKTKIAMTNLGVHRSRYAAFYERGTTAKALIIPNKAILDINPAFCEWIGYHKKELLKIPIENLIHKEDRSMGDAYERDVLQGHHDVYREEKRFIRKDGQVVWGLFSATAVLDPREKLQSFAVEIADLTREKNAEAARREAERSWHEAEEPFAGLETERRIARHGGVLGDAEREPAPSHAYDIDLDEAYQMAEEVINHLFELSGDMLAIIGDDGYYKRVSAVFPHLLGFKRDDLEEKPVAGFLHPLDQEAIETFKHRLLHESPGQHIEIRHRCADGSYRWLSLDATFNSNHEVIYAVFRLLDSPPPVEADVHESAASPVTRSGQDRIAGPSPRSSTQWKSAARRDLSFSEEHLFPSPAPSPAHSLEKPALALDPTGLFEPMRIEPEQTAPSATGQTAPQGSWQQIAEDMPFMVWILDEHRQCTYTNKKVQDFTGRGARELLGQGLSQALHPDDHLNYERYVEEFINERKPIGYTYRLRRADRQYRWIQESGVPLFGSEGEFEGYLTTGLDISNLKRVGALFSKALESALNLGDLSTALAPCSRDECINAISDSIRVGDALTNQTSELPHTELAHLMQLAGRRLLGLVNGMLSFEKVKPRSFEHLEQTLIFQEVVSSVVGSQASVQNERSPRFRINRSNPAIRIKADKMLLYRILGSLIRGLSEGAESRVISMDFSADDTYGRVSLSHLGPVLSASFLVDQADLYRETAHLPRYHKKSGLQLALIHRIVALMGGAFDVTPGEEHGSVMTLSFPLAVAPAPSTHSPASGPGRSIRDEPDAPPLKLVPRATPPDPLLKPEEMADHNYGENIQRLAEIVDAIETLVPPESSPGPHYYDADGADVAAHAGRQRVLVGEPNSDTQRLLRSLLQPHYDLTIVPDTDALLQQADETTYDLFLLDIHLKGEGGFTGLDVLQELRRRPQYYRTPVIAVANGTSQANKRDLVDRQGFDFFLSKPFSIVELLDTVGKMIGSEV